MKTLISALSISAALLAPVATFAATTAPSAAAPATPASVTVTATATPSQDKTSPTRVAMNKQADASFGKQASDDREGLSRIVEQLHQLGATN